MWISKKKLQEMQIKIADLESKTQSQQFEGKTPVMGYVSTTNILSDYMVIRFAVPCREWNELEKSKAWKDFQALFEKIQEEFYQQKHQAAEW